MQDFPKFHQLACDLIHHLGLDVPDIEASRDTFTMLIDEKYTVHLGLIDDVSWFMLAELDNPEISRNPERLRAAMRLNQLTHEAGQPIVALDASGGVNCWVRLSLADGDLPTSLGALHGLLGTLDAM